MTIDLTNDQYVSLLRIVFLGQWVANSFKTEPLTEFEDIEQHIMSYAKRFGADDLVVHGKKENRWFPTREMEDAMHVYIDEYDEDTFVDELVYRLARRDVLKIFGEQYYGMTMEERIKADEPFLEKYYTELGNNGIQNIGIVNDQGTDLGIN